MSVCWQREAVLGRMHLMLSYCNKAVETELHRIAHHLLLKIWSVLLLFEHLQFRSFRS